MHRRLAQMPPHSPWAKALPGLPTLAGYYGWTCTMGQGVYIIFNEATYLHLRIRHFFILNLFFFAFVCYCQILQIHFPYYFPPLVAPGTHWVQALGPGTGSDTAYAHECVECLCLLFLSLSPPLLPLQCILARDCVRLCVSLCVSLCV